MPTYDPENLDEDSKIMKELMKERSKYHYNLQAVDLSAGVSSHGTSSVIHTIPQTRRNYDNKKRLKTYSSKQLKKKESQQFVPFKNERDRLGRLFKNIDDVDEDGDYG